MIEEPFVTTGYNQSVFNSAYQTPYFTALSTSPYTVTTSVKNNKALALDQAIVLMGMYDVGITSVKDLIKTAKILENYLDGN